MLLIMGKSHLIHHRFCLSLSLILNELFVEVGGFL